MVERNYASELAAVQSASPPTNPDDYGWWMSTLARIGQALPNPGGYAAEVLGPPATAMAQGVVDLGQQAGQALTNPSAIGVYGSGQQPDFYAGGQRPGYETGVIDPGVTVPFATNMAGAVETGGLALSRPVSNAAGMGIRAYHGSPHDFERFDLGKIGTGEGAQAYGHGLYFAESPGVAKAYREQLAGNRLEFPDLGTVRNQTYGDTDLVHSAVRAHASALGVNQEFDGPVRQLLQSRDTSSLVAEALDETANDIDGAIRFLREKAEVEPQRLVTTYVPADVARKAGTAYGQAADALEAMKAKGLKQSEGRTYEVDIDASPDEFLDWDKPLSEQSPAVKKKLNEVYGRVMEAGDLGVKGRMSGGEFYNWLDEPGRPARAFEALQKKLGIKGIRYKDAGSRKLPSTPATDLAQGYLRDAGGDIDKALASYDAHIATVPARLRDASMDEIRDAIRMGGRPVEQTHNYVVFDDKTISILKKYGLAGLTAGGAGAAMLGGSTDQASATEK